MYIYFFVLQAGDQIITVVIMFYILYTSLSLVAGQLAHNQWKNFHRMLTRLYNTLIILGEELYNDIFSTEIVLTIKLWHTLFEVVSRVYPINLFSCLKSEVPSLISIVLMLFCQIQRKLKCE